MKFHAKSQATLYTYDPLNRLTQITRADGTQVSFTYDQNDGLHGAGIGRLTRMSDPSGVTDWSYDGNGHVTKKSVVSGGITLSSQYAYDAATGQPRSQTCPPAS